MGKVDRRVHLFVGRGGSDLHLRVGCPSLVRTDGDMGSLPDESPLRDENLQHMTGEIIPDKMRRNSMKSRRRFHIRDCWYAASAQQCRNCPIWDDSGYFV